MFKVFVLTGFIAALFLASPTFAQGKSKAKPEKEAVKAVKEVTEVKAFSKVEIGIIAEVLGLGHAGEEIYTDQYGKTKGKGKGKGRGDGLPPGLVKHSQLPPGLAKMQTLPPGLSKSRLPYDLESRLPPPPPGTERFIIGGLNVVLVEKKSGRVVDIIGGKVNKNKLAEAEKRSAETLRHKGRGEAADGDPDRPLVTGRVPNADEPASDVDRVIRKKPGRTRYDPGATSDQKEEKEDKGKGRKKK